MRKGAENVTWFSSNPPQLYPLLTLLQSFKVTKKKMKGFVLYLKKKESKRVLR